MAGAALAGRDLRPLGRFPPPLDLPRDYPPFSWLAAGLVLGVSGAIAAGWIRPWSRSRGTRIPNREAGAGDPAGRAPPPAGRRSFPWWGWAAVAWMLAWWWLAWTRQPWLAWGQRYTFTPLWLGLIVATNALAWRRGGTALMTRTPSRWLRLFGASAVFWWVFEWLNRFVHNWHYLGIAGVGAWEYATHTTVCFSTVLPAVAGMREWLGTWPRLQARLAGGPAWPWLLERRAAAAALAVGALSLVLTGVLPSYFFPALWAAPLLIGVGGSVLAGADGWWRRAAAGDWRDAGSWALAALACGFLWELWNWHSLAKWVYTVPFVQRWPVFEMPALGYTGYLAFGLECALAAQWALTTGVAFAPVPRRPDAAQPAGSAQ